MIHVEPKDIPNTLSHSYLLGGVGPRPIALVSTLSTSGVRNLSPFSYFNGFGVNPVTVAFSPARRNRDGTFKHTYYNLTESKECVIQCVTYSMLHQINLASTEWEDGIDEFKKSGLTPEPSDIVKPPRVKESPFQMECKLKQLLQLGEGPGFGNLAICEVVKFHIAEDLLEGNVIQPNRIDLVARMGGDWYTRASGDAVFKLAKPTERSALGYDNLPEVVKKSKILSASNLAQLAACKEIPSGSEVRKLANETSAGEYTLESFYRFQRQDDYKGMLAAAMRLLNENQVNVRDLFELTAKSALDSADDRLFAWKVLVYLDQLMAMPPHS